MAMPNLLNILHQLRRTENFLTECVSGRYFQLPTAFQEEARQQRLIIQTILRKHKEKSTRKDIRLPTK